MRDKSRLKNYDECIVYRDEQCGFVEGNGTSNAIYILRTLSERMIDMNRDMYVCFIDYTQVFDKVKHEEFIRMLEPLNIDGKDLILVKNIYRYHEAAIRIENQFGTFQRIKQGVRQGCVLSPGLFNLYSELIMRSIQDIPGITVGER